MAGGGQACRCFLVWRGPSLSHLLCGGGQKLIVLTVLFTTFILVVCGGDQTVNCINCIIYYLFLYLYVAEAKRVLCQ